MSQSNEALAAEPVEQEQQQPEPQGLMEQARQDNPVSHETNEQPGDIPHLEPDPDAEPDGPYERPDWFPEKFWDDDGPNLENMAESYNNLEKKFSQGKHKAPEKYDVSFMEEAGVQSDDELATFFTGWAKDNGISQAAFEDLAGKVLAMGSETAEAETISLAQEKKMLGDNADEIIKSNLIWADGLKGKGIISEEELNEIDIWGGTAVGARLLQKVRSMTGENVTIPTTTAFSASKESEDDFRSRINAKMSDPKYGTDPSYTRAVEKEFEDRYK
tara:strand:- start:1113 stop:1934 length:822 start_codon:yes stop_codon:yes gene_type:complete